MNLVNLADKLALFSDHWPPAPRGVLNGQEVRLAEVQGEFLWHRHAEEEPPPPVTGTGRNPEHR